jgi:hypothetical protein
VEIIKRSGEVKIINKSKKVENEENWKNEKVENKS